MDASKATDLRRAYSTLPCHWPMRLESRERDRRYESRAGSVSVDRKLSSSSLTILEERFSSLSFTRHSVLSLSTWWKAGADFRLFSSPRAFKGRIAQSSRKTFSSAGMLQSDTDCADFTPFLKACSFKILARRAEEGGRWGEGVRSVIATKRGEEPERAQRSS